MKTFEQFINKKNMTIKDFPYVMEFFKKYNKNIGDIPVYVISEEKWPDGKARQTENDLKGGIKIHEKWIGQDKEIGWLIHEVGHVLDLRGEKKPYLISRKEFNGYPNEDNEQTPMWFQFTYMINNGLSEDDVIRLEKESYSNCKGGKTLWKKYKDKFFRRYYQEIKKKLNLNENVRPDIDPYGEENWDDKEGKEVYDYSDENLDDVVENLRILVVDKTTFGWIPSNFYYTKMVVIDGDINGNTIEYGAGQAIDHINDIFIDEDGGIMLTGTKFVYIEETDDYIGHDVYYTLDTNHPILIGDKIEIKL